MALSNLLIREIQKTAGDLLLIGHYSDESDTITRQVILRKGVEVTDLSMKKGDKYALEIRLPPMTFMMFSDLLNYSPTECQFDKEASAAEFQITIGYYKNTTRTVSTTFTII